MFFPLSVCSHSFHRCASHSYLAICTSRWWQGSNIKNHACEAWNWNWFFRNKNYPKAWDWNFFPSIWFAQTRRKRRAIFRSFWFQKHILCGTIFLFLFPSSFFDLICNMFVERQQYTKLRWLRRIFSQWRFWFFWNKQCWKFGKVFIFIFLLTHLDVNFDKHHYRMVVACNSTSEAIGPGNLPLQLDCML